MLRHHSRLVGWFIAASAVNAASRAGAQETATRASTTPATSIAGEVSYQSFNGDLDAWKLASAALWRRNGAGTFIARVNYAHRFGTDGVQVEADAYPRLTDKAYLYLNAGYSSASVFPEWRTGAEAFSALPGAWEASAGFRQLRFADESVTMLTGAVGKYVGNYWFSVRPYVRSKDGTTTATTAVWGRRYFADAEHWVGGLVTFGSSPTERITPDAVSLNRTVSVALSGSTGVTDKLLMTWLIGHDTDRLAAGNTRQSVTLTAGLRRRW